MWPLSGLFLMAVDLDFLLSLPSTTRNGESMLSASASKFWLKSRSPRAFIAFYSIVFH
jgi:hypothetical protein